MRTLSCNRYLLNHVYDLNLNAKSGCTNDDKFSNALKFAILDHKNKNTKAANKKTGEQGTKKKLLCTEDLPENHQ